MEELMYYVSECIYPKENGLHMDGWIIEHDRKYPFWVNKFLHLMNNSSIATARQYAYKLCKFLNYLEEYHSIEYSKATTAHLNKYITYLKYGSDSLVVNISEAKKSGFTLKGYYTVIKRFYEYLYNNNQDLAVELKIESSSNKRSYLYGQQWESKKVKLIIENSFERSKAPIQYEKWYTNEQKEAILSHFNTYRDKSIFSMTCDGMRIDEVITAKLEDYDCIEGTLNLYQSKGYQAGEANRICILSEQTRKLLDEYLYNERAEIENELLSDGVIPSNTIFLNLRKRDDSYGTPVKYHNIYEIIKRAGKNAGFDPKLIRTHSGRSTKAGELFRAQAKNPESLTDNQIAEMMGWKNLSSASPYKNRQDKETAIENWKTLQRAKDERHENENKS
jgi:integrase